MWGKLAETCGKALYKGRLVYVEGQIKNRTYEKDGSTRFVSEIEADEVRFLDKPDRSKQNLDTNDVVEEANNKYATPFG